MKYLATKIHGASASLTKSPVDKKIVTAWHCAIGERGGFGFEICYQQKNPLMFFMGTWRFFCKNSNGAIGDNQ